MDTLDIFVEDLVRAVPELKPLYDDHMEFNKELLSHSLIGDVALLVGDGLSRFKTHRFDDKVNEIDVPAIIGPLMNFLEQGVLTRGELVEEMIVVSFIEPLFNFPGTLAMLKPSLPPTLKMWVKRVQQSDLPPVAGSPPSRGRNSEVRKPGDVVELLE